MDKNTIISNLNKFGYKYDDLGEHLIVKLDFSLQIILDFTNPDKISIQERLKSWNFLTMSAMSLKGAILYNFIGALVIGVLIVWMMLVKPFDQWYLVFIFFFLMFWCLIWTTIYLLKSENFKRQVMDWIKK